MPFVKVHTVEGALTGDQKEELQRRITDLMVEIEGGGNSAFRPYVWILIEEHSAEDWTLGGHHPTAENLQAVRKAS